jgi:hypothetical protein
MEASDFYTLCFLEEPYRDILQYCGTHSGKDVDKLAETGLVPLTTETGNIYYEQCKLVLECRKLYADWLTEDSFVAQSLAAKNTPRKITINSTSGRLSPALKRFSKGIPESLLKYMAPSFLFVTIFEVIF